MRRELNAALTLLVVVFNGCGPSESPDARREALRAILAADRDAHLQTRANLLASHLADTLLSIDAGRVTWQPRDSVRDRFARYFQDATYHAWTDHVPPIIELSPDGRQAWVVRTVCVDREEPDGEGGRRRRVFTSAYTSTYAWRRGAWLMTSVTSTFASPPPVSCSGET